MTLSRRDFLATSAGGLILGFALPLRRQRLAVAAPQAPVALNAFLRIAPDESITVSSNHSEMGQGVWTMVPMVIADELDADWKTIRVEHALSQPPFAHPVWGEQGTGGSSSTRDEFDRLRKVGASARAMLVAAAALRWKVAPETLRTENGFVVRGQERLSYGALAAAAARLAPPGDVKLKEPAAWTLIGKPQKRLDGPEKVTGQAIFGADVRLPGMLTAVVERAPVFGATLKGWEIEKPYPGVKKIVKVPSGVAVVADSFWAAQRGREGLRVDWDLGPGATLDSDAILNDFRDRSRRPGTVAAQHGDAASAYAAAEHKVEAVYDVPYLAHAPMEPLNATVRWGRGTAEVWIGTQAQTQDQTAIAKVLGLPPAKVTLHTMFLGGGFGRRASANSDFAIEAAEVVKAYGQGATVKTMWTREDDLAGGWYRPLFVHRFAAGLTATGELSAWVHTIVGQPLGEAGKDGIDHASVEGAADAPYLDAIGATGVTLHSPKLPIPVLWWRSVGSSHTAFAVECFIDEIAASVKTDPAELRRRLLKNHPRWLRVLERLVDASGWGKRPPEGRARGLAIHESFGSTVGEVAEVSVEGGKIRVHKMTCVVDCGLAVNPAGVTAQMQSGIVYGLSAALLGKLTLKNGRVQETNFDDYRILRMPDAPEVDVIILPSTDKMGGAGEPGTPPIAPAVGNAVFTLTGQRLRSLPFKLG